MSLDVRLGAPGDAEAALSVYERSNLARRKGVWPNRAERLEQVRAILGDSGTWFLLALDGAVPVGMAAAQPLLGDDGVGPPVPGGCFLNLIFVVPERWGEGIGRTVLDTVLAEAKRRGYERVHLFTHENNERSQRLYASRGFSRTGRVVHGEAEWASALL